jgi:hypothetical protein
MTALNQRVYRSLYRVRRVEEEVARLYPSDQIKSPVHLSIGQEAVSVGVCEALRPDDVVFGTYRGHALYLAKGGSRRKMMAELYGKATVCAKGKGGSMHLIDPDRGVMGMSAVVEACQEQGETIQVRRMGFEPVPCPTTKPLENLFYPNSRTIAAAVHAMVRPSALAWMPEGEDPPEIEQFKGPF